MGGPNVNTFPTETTENCRFPVVVKFINYAPGDNDPIVRNITALLSPLSSEGDLSICYMQHLEKAAVLSDSVPQTQGEIITFGILYFRNKPNERWVQDQIVNGKYINWEITHPMPKTEQQPPKLQPSPQMVVVRTA